MRIAVVDDDDRTVAEITNLLQRYYSDTYYEQDIFSDGKEFVQSLERQKKYDIVFMDIEMPEINGEEAVTKLRQYDVNEEVYVVFVSSHSDDLIGLFGLHPFDFIVKPIDNDAFFNMLHKMQKKMSSKRQTVLLRLCRKNTEVLLADIRFIQSEGHKILVYTNGDIKPLVAYMKLDEFMSLIEGKSYDFVRTHTSFVINRCYVTRVRKDSVQVGEVEIPISNKYRSRILISINGGG